MPQDKIPLDTLQWCSVMFCLSVLHQYYDSVISTGCVIAVVMKRNKTFAHHLHFTTYTLYANVFAC